MIVSVTWKGWIPQLHMEDKQSYASKTKEFDDMAMQKLSYVLYVIVIGYSIYALVYETHKSWYSWILSSLVGAVYTFGMYSVNCRTTTVPEGHHALHWRGIGTLRRKRCTHCSSAWPVFEITQAHFL